MSYWRALLILGLLTVAFIGYKEARLTIRCPAALDLGALSLKDYADLDPLWARFSARAPAEPMIVATESGTARVWAPLASTSTPGTIVAVAEFDNLEEAKRLQAKASLVVEGLAYLPTRDEDRHLRAYLGSSGTRLDQFRVLELGGKPRGLMSSVLLLVLGIAGALWAFKSKNVLFRRKRLGSTEALLDSLTLPSETELARTRYAEEPLDEEASAAIRDMVSDVWNQVG